MKEEEITLSDEHPELDPKHVVKVIRRHGLNPTPPKASVSLRIDQDVLDWFKAQGPGYQTRINIRAADFPPPLPFVG
jgi:uncharacterized protein (DUF4415 family)